MRVEALAEQVLWKLLRLIPLLAVRDDLRLHEGPDLSPPGVVRLPVVRTVVSAVPRGVAERNLSCRRRKRGVEGVSAKRKNWLGAAGARTLGRSSYHLPVEGLAALSYLAFQAHSGLETFTTKVLLALPLLLSAIREVQSETFRAKNARRARGRGEFGKSDRRDAPRLPSRYRTQGSSRFSAAAPSLGKSADAPRFFCYRVRRGRKIVRHNGISTRSIWRGLWGWAGGVWFKVRRKGKT